MSKFIDLSGRVFGKLTVIEYCGNDKWRVSKWLCLCDCGKKIILTSNHLKSGSTKSCGCLRKEKTKLRFTKHNYKNTTIYNTWINMKQRCYNNNCPDYKNYGGRGIKVCDRWLKFENFYADVGDPPKGLTLDRPNNDGNYQTDNWRWATRKEQARNTRRNHTEIFNNMIQYRIILAEKYNIDAKLLGERLDKLGWPIGKALITPVRKSKKNG